VSETHAIHELIITSNNYEKESGTTAGQGLNLSSR